MKISTKTIRTNVEKTSYREHTTPMFLTSSFIFDSVEQGKNLFDEEEKGDIYSRFSNPNITEFEKKICALEGAEDGLAFATGMASIFTTMSALLKSGDHVLSQREVFGSTHQIFNQIFPKWGITYSYISGNNIEDWERACTPSTRLIYLETPANPGLSIYDIERLAELAQSKKCVLIVDNCFATPVLQLPIEMSADLVIHSATKFIDGQGRVLGGVVVGKKELIDKIRFFLRHTGPSMSPFTAWILSKSLETLEVRMDRHCENAMKIAHTLESLPGIKHVRYPFLPSHPDYKLAKKQMKHGGALVSFELEGNYKTVEDFCNSLTIPSLASNLGDTRTILTHPFTTTHSKLSDKEKRLVGVTDTLLRMSVGLENIEDIIEDFRQALRISTLKRKV